LIAWIVPVAFMVGCGVPQQNNTPESDGTHPKQAIILELDDILLEAQGNIHKASEQNDLSYLDRAEALLQKAAKVNPHNSLTYAIWANLYLCGGNLSNTASNAKMTGREYHLRAIQLFEKALKIDPASAEALDGLGNLYFNSELKDIEKAAHYLERLIRTDAAQASDYTRLGMCYDSLKKPEKAVKLYLAAAKFGEERKDKMARIRALEMLGRLYQRTGNLELAEQYLNESTKELAQLKKVNDDLYWACPYSALGDLYSQLGQPTRQTKVLVKAADMEPGSIKAQFEAAWMSYHTGDYQNALKYIDRSVELDQNSCLKQMKGYVYLLQRRFEKAREFFSNFSKNSASEMEAMVGLGHLAIVDKDYEKATRLLQDAATEAQNRADYVNADAYSSLELSCRNFPYKMVCLGLGWTAGNQDKHGEAMKYFQRVLDTDPKDILALLGKANSLGGLHRLDEAQRLYKKILEIYPDNVYALAELGRIHYNQGDDQAAEKVYRKALEQDVDHYTCPYEGLGLIFMRRGKLAEAKEYLQKSIDINPNIEFKKFNALAKIYIDEGRFGEAKKLLAKSIENYPYDDEAKRMLKEIEGKSHDSSAKKLH
jgi:tetratricopeptide (TPR) repeat protein